MCGGMIMIKYCALLVAPDGDYVTDYYSDTKEKVVKKLANRGSRWFFYPFEFVVTERLGRIVDAPPELEFFKGKSVKKVLEIFKETSDRMRHLCYGIDIDFFDYIDFVRTIFLGKYGNHKC